MRDQNLEKVCEVKRYLEGTCKNRQLMVSCSQALKILHLELLAFPHRATSQILVLQD